MAKWSSKEIREASKYGQGTGHFQRMVLEILADLVERAEKMDAADAARTAQLVASLGVQTGQGKKAKSVEEPKSDKNDAAV